MDVVLRIADEYVLDKAWAHLVPSSAFNATMVTAGGGAWTTLVSRLPHPTPLPSSLLDVSAWPRDYILRQAVSLTAITLLGAHLLYFLFATLSYYLVFDHDMMKHPRFLKNQIQLEIRCSLEAFPGMMMLTLPWFVAEVRGYSKLYNNWDDYGWAYLFFSVPFFLVFTDYLVYWIHRTLHVPFIYKRLHKPHHKWIIPTPFASHAFHPVDGYLQSTPYHIFVFLFPLHRYVYLGLFVFVNIWTIFIHDSELITDHPLESVINGPSHHTLHHMFFSCNYGQYFTLADKMGGSYRHPEKEMDPKLEVLAILEKEKKEKEGKLQ